jgi:hypothetical protein
MLQSLVVGFLLIQAAQQPSATVTPAPTADIERAQILRTAKRIFVDSFGEDLLSKTVQSMVVDAVGSTKRFIVTENREKADLILKGAALEKTSQEMHALSSGTTVAGASGGGSSQISGHSHGGTATLSGSSSSGFSAQKLAIDDSQASVETVNDARAAVRLVSRDGDVVWSTTQESKGAKYKGATADVAEKIVKQLLRDLAKLDTPKPAER